METVKVTNLQIENFRSNARNYLGRKSTARTKLHYALTKMLMKTETAFQRFQEEQQDIRTELAMTDDKKALIIDDKNNYSYTKEDAKKMNDKLRELGKREIEIENYTVEAPKDLEPIYWEVFVPFVLEDKEPA